MTPYAERMLQRNRANRRNRRVYTGSTFPSQETLANMRTYGFAVLRGGASLVRWPIDVPLYIDTDAMALHILHDGIAQLVLFIFASQVDLPSAVRAAVVLHRGGWTVDALRDTRASQLTRGEGGPSELIAQARETGRRVYCNLDHDNHR